MREQRRAIGNLEFMRVRQRFDGQPVESDLPAAVERELERGEPDLVRLAGRGGSVAVALGSRGIRGLPEVVAALIAGLKRRGYEPFVVPAMGSHGGATPAGQAETLARLGITEESVGVPVRSQGTVLKVAETDTGLAVLADRLAAGADALIPVNRIYTHTMFEGEVESGLLKMLAIGLGKEEAAAAAHRAALIRGLGTVIREVGEKAVAAMSIPFGLALVENARRQVAMVRAVLRDGMAEAEAALLKEAKRLKPRIPFDFLHLLIVDQMGKNFSGTGIDTKVVGRMLQTGEPEPATPRIQRIYVADLSPETGGNAHGMGLADFISQRLADKIDEAATRTNAVTACAPQRARRPPVVSCDREGIELSLSTAGVTDPAAALVVRIANTRDLEWLWISEALREEAVAAGLEIAGQSLLASFDKDGNIRGELSGLTSH